MTPFSTRGLARWAEMDFNQHMRNAAFLGAGEDCRIQFLASRGHGVEALIAAGIGPVVVEDRLTYRHELRLLDAYRVELRLAGITHDGRRMRVRNTILHERDGSVAATVESVVLWLDLRSRRPTSPPDALRDAWLSLQRTDDFEWLDAPARAP